MSLELFISETNEIETDFVCRNFNLGDRVNVYFKEKFYSGKVVNKTFRDGFFGRQPYLFIKTDEKVDEDKDALFEGYGIRVGQMEKFILKTNLCPMEMKFIEKV
jgi:hypothetical protein